MSGVLARLRDSFDDPLFVRVQRGVGPTNRALELAPQVKKVLNEVEQLLQPPQFDPTTAELTVRIACTDYAMRAVIVPFLHLLKTKPRKLKSQCWRLTKVRFKISSNSGKSILHW